MKAIENPFFFDNLALEYIVKRIKQVNTERLSQGVQLISEDDTNEVLSDILHDASDIFDIELKDDYDVLADAFNKNGADIIRQAEAGNYN